MKSCSTSNQLALWEVAHTSFYCKCRKHRSKWSEHETKAKWDVPQRTTDPRYNIPGL